MTTNVESERAVQEGERLCKGGQADSVRCSVCCAQWLVIAYIVVYVVLCVGSSLTRWRQPVSRVCTYVWLAELAAAAAAVMSYAAPRLCFGVGGGCWDGRRTCTWTLLAASYCRWLKLNTAMSRPPSISTTAIRCTVHRRAAQSCTDRQHAAALRPGTSLASPCEMWCAGARDEQTD